jgi:dolichyl-phosphate-mannose--protein O-mannosyl transferase
VTKTIGASAPFESTPEIDNVTGSRFFGVQLNIQTPGAILLTLEFSPVKSITGMMVGVSVAFESVIVIVRL